MNEAQLHQALESSAGTCWIMPEDPATVLEVTAWFQAWSQNEAGATVAKPRVHINAASVVDPKVRDSRFMDAEPFFAKARPYVPGATV